MMLHTGGVMMLHTGGSANCCINDFPVKIIYDHFSRYAAIIYIKAHMLTMARDHDFCY